MKTTRLTIGATVALILTVLLATPAIAVEGGLERPVASMQIAPFAGVVPPEPGFALAIGETLLPGLHGRGGLSRKGTVTQ
jgi:hypothetical protein